MVALKAEAGIEHISARIRASIIPRARPTDWRVTALLQREMIGSVDGSAFWLQSTRPHINGFPQRYFQGQIVESQGATIIAGKFRFSPFFKMSTMIVCLILTVISLVLLINEKNVLALVPLAGICFMLITPWIGLPFYRQDEKAVIEFLQAICKGE